MHAPLFGPWVHAPFLGPWVSAWVGNRRRSCLWGLDDGLTLHTCLQFQTQVPLALVSPGLGQQVGQLPREGKGGGLLQDSSARSTLILQWRPGHPGFQGGHFSGGVSHVGMGT